MPIYAYRCETCGHAKDVLQKISDEPLSLCPSCGADTFRKQLTAAGFQLKGSGWYVTDFRDKPADKATKPASGDESKAGAATPAAPAAGTDKPAAGPAPAAAASPAAPAAPSSGSPSTS